VILVTVGSQLPFDRLVKAVDAWAGQHPDELVVAQIGKTAYAPVHMQWQSFLSPSEFKRRCKSAHLIVAHAGTGSILTAMQMGKPILVMPRRRELRETRNDHQIGTAKRFGQFRGAEAAFDERQLIAKLNTMHQVVAHCSVGQYASEPLLQTIRRFIESV